MRKTELHRRSPMPQRTVSLSRTGGLRKRGKKKRTGEDLAFRRTYRAANGRCELSHLFPDDYLPTEGGLQALVGHDDPIDVHHILHPPRLDVLSNLICARRQIHDWLGRYVVDGKVICLALKARKGELDPVELKPLFKPGVTLLDWIEAREHRLKFPLSRRCYVELVERLRRAG